MEWPKAPSLQALKPSRRRLQKSLPKPKHFWAKRGSQDSAISIHDAYISSPIQPTNTHTISIPGDINDSRWLEHLERTGLMSPSDMPSSPHTSRPSTTQRIGDHSPTLIPEFSHLAISPRPSTDGSLPLPPPIPAPETHSLRRSAKTPVFRVGQLERSARERNIRRKKRQSVELIADQYRALIESQDPIDEVATPDEEPAGEILLTSRYYNDNNSASSSTANESDNAGRVVTIEHTGVLLPPNPSPRSEGSTLVGFEEDVIYFKPISFSEDCASPPAAQTTEIEAMAQLAPIQEDSRDHMQTCVDLLTKELSSSMTRQGTQPNPAPLQIWAMIEAYQRLRAHVAAMGLSETEQRSVSGMFDCWLSALNTIHGTLSTGEAITEREYQDLAEDVN